MKRYSQTSALISSILPASATCVLTSRSWTSEATWYVSSSTMRREEVRVADRVEDRRARPIAAGQHQPDGVAAGRAADPAGRGRWRAITSSRSPGTMTSARGPMRWSMCSRLHRPDGDPADDLVEVRPGMDGLAVDPLEDHRQGRVRQDRPVRQDAQQRDAVAGQAALQGPGQVGLGQQVDLVDDRPGDGHARRARTARR